MGRWRGQDPSLEEPSAGSCSPDTRERCAFWLLRDEAFMGGPVSCIFTQRMSSACVQGCAGAGGAENKAVHHSAVCGVL